MTKYFHFSSLVVCLVLVACGGSAAPASSAPAASVAAGKPSAAASAKPSAAASVSAKPAASAAASAAAKPGASVAASAGAKPNAASIAQRWTDLFSKGDSVGVGTLFTDDAAFAGGAPCNVKTICVGLPGIAERVKRAAAV